MRGEAVDLTVAVHIRPSIRWRSVEGEAILLDLDSGKYYGLDSTATRIWGLLEEHARPSVVVEKMLEEYDVSRKECSTDVARFVERLQEMGLLGPNAGGCLA